jgi:hypothetical protein
MPELTLTVDGAFWSPFAPTYKNGALQKDLLISTTTQPLHIPVDILLSYMKQVPFDVNADSGFV